MYLSEYFLPQDGAPMRGQTRPGTPKDAARRRIPREKAGQRGGCR